MDIKQAKTDTFVFALVIKICQLNPPFRFVPNDRPKLQIFPQKGIRVEVHNSLLFDIMLNIVVVDIKVIIIIIMMISMMTMITEIKVVPATCLPI